MYYEKNIAIDVIKSRTKMMIDATEIYLVVLLYLNNLLQIVEAINPKLDMANNIIPYPQPLPK